jgi:hypothetical protein
VAVVARYRTDAVLERHARRIFRLAGVVASGGSSAAAGDSARPLPRDGIDD